jgi:hypothetical protein
MQKVFSLAELYGAIIQMPLMERDYGNGILMVSQGPLRRILKAIGFGRKHNSITGRLYDI